MTILLKYIPCDPIHDKWALAQEMAWHRTWDKPILSELSVFYILPLSPWDTTHQLANIYT